MYRNDHYVTSISSPNTVYNDFGGDEKDEYYLVAYDHEGRFSEKSAVGAPTAGPVTDLRADRSTRGVYLSWKSGADRWLILKDNTFWQWYYGENGTQDAVRDNGSGYPPGDTYEPVPSRTVQVGRPALLTPIG